MMLPSSLINKTEWVLVGPMGPEPTETLSQFPIIAIDGGAHHLECPDIWVGDADSYEKKVSCKHVFRHPPKKDLSDFALALSLFKVPHHYKLHLWGLLGGRRDHELFNFGESSRFLDRHSESEIIFYGSDGKIHFHFLGAGTWKFSHEGLFSLGTLKNTLVKLRGNCQFPIPKLLEITPLSSFGLSNVGEGEMTLENQGPVFLYYPGGK